MDVCLGWLKIIIFKLFLTLEENNRFTAQAKRKFWHLSHTPANRNSCPYCKHFLTSPTNTRILSLSLKNRNFKFITTTRAASQPVALFFIKLQIHKFWSGSTCVHWSLLVQHCKPLQGDGDVDHLVCDQRKIHGIIQPHIKPRSLWVFVGACISDIQFWRLSWHQGYVYLYTHTHTPYGILIYIYIWRHPGTQLNEYMDTSTNNNTTSK